jgi:hypothetical protein
MPWRVRAQRARYLAKGLTQDADRARLHEYAEELEKRAAELVCVPKIRFAVDAENGPRKIAT